MAKNNTKSAEQLEIWQWNCRTFHKRAAALQNYIISAPIQPDVICLQEVGPKMVKLQGYYCLQDLNYPRVATLVSKSIAAKMEHIDSLEINHQIISLLPLKRGRARTVIVNLYSPPKDRNEDFAELLTEAVRIAGARDRLVVLGDFNAPNTTWGYPRDSPKGTRLEHAVSKLGLSLITLPTTPTRMGNSVSRDTFPDLTFTRNIKDTNWTNLEENLGSDHHIIGISLSTPKLRRVIGDVVITDWERFRRHSPPPDSVPESMGDWLEYIRSSHKQTSKRITRTAETPAVDRHLLHLWESRRSLLKRWKNQRLNRNLLRRIAALAEEANQYASKLATEGWIQFCSSLQDTLSTAKTWVILRNMLDPENSKSVTSKTLQRITNDFSGTDEELIQFLKNRYIGEDTNTTRSPINYTGVKNERLDAPITKEEVFAATQAAKKKYYPWCRPNYKRND